MYLGRKINSNNKNLILIAQFWKKRGGKSEKKSPLFCSEKRGARGVLSARKQVAVLRVI